MDNVVLVPRINESVIHSLDSKTLNVAEKCVTFEKGLQEMYQLLIEIMQACLDEASVQLKLHFKNLDPNPEIAAVTLLTVENAVLPEFDSTLRR